MDRARVVPLRHGLTESRLANLGASVLLVSAWGSMDRYHLAWLQVGRPSTSIRGRAMSPDEEAGYVREVAAAKTAVLRMSVDSLTRRGMPFVGETRD